ncbi:MAG: cytochrome c-type biogenesis protein CcmH [Anaerolineaceae bacterium]|nr:cytochrome c-type biogenesis protein CcmH [Anaerolineaceae bacterium]MDE0329061.1 cytochrome c-type biogenesis protein CcmH [Anaerolineaceae bacterium]
MKGTLLALVLTLLTLPVLAQPASDDEVNRVAARLYCPVCEYVPLDDCETAACRQWKAEIRHQLDAGQSPQAIIDDFVARFGQQVVGTPTDPTLRALALLTPWALALGALLPGALLLRRWARQRKTATPSQDALEAQDAQNDYRARVEADLHARR